MRTRLVAVLAGAGLVLAVVTGLAVNMYHHDTPPAAPTASTHYHNAPLAAPADVTHFHNVLLAAEARVTHFHD